MSLRHVSLVLLLAAGASAEPDLPATPVLGDGVVVHASLLVGRATWTARVDVPEDAVALGVAVSGDEDVDLHLRRGRPALDDPRDEADASAVGGSVAEALVLTRESSPALAPGSWFVTVRHPGAAKNGVSFEVVAFVERGDGPRTLLPGGTVSGTLPGGGGSVSFRTFLPRRARALDLAFRARDPSSVRFSVVGPEGYVRSGPGMPRLLVARDEAPPGPYLFTLTSDRGSTGERPVTATASWARADDEPSSDEDEHVLEPGAPWTVLLGGRGEADTQAMRLRVPPGTGGFVLAARTEGEGDVDLYVRRDAPVGDGDDDAEWLALTSGRLETLVVGGTKPLVPGVYHAKAVLVDSSKRTEVTLLYQPGAPGAARPTWEATEGGPLADGTWVAGEIRPRESAVAWHAVEVPAGAGSLHVRVIDATSPLDLLVAKRPDGAIFLRSLTHRVDEVLDQIFEAPLPEARRFYVGVLSREPAERMVTYRIAAAADARPALPADLAWPPRVATEGASVAERTAAAAVDLTVEDGSGGSGTCVGPRGLVLTCRHVLERGDAAGDPRPIQREGVLLGFSRRLDQPAVQAFVARVVEDDAELDLALLEPVEDVFGRPLPEALDLPWTPLGDSTKLKLADAVTACGFPEAGSTHTRTAVVLSRGIVAGLERSPGEAPWIKTDAWIGLGHSGGSLVDAEGRLVGVPAATLGSAERIGLVIPVEVLPAAWRKRIEAGQGR